MPMVSVQARARRVGSQFLRVGLGCQPGARSCTPPIIVRCLLYPYQCALVVQCVISCIWYIRQYFNHTNAVCYSTYILSPRNREKKKIRSKKIFNFPKYKVAQKVYIYNYLLLITLFSPIAVYILYGPPWVLRNINISSS